MPAIDADQEFRLEFIGRFFQCFAHCTCRQGFIRFPVSGGLIEQQALGSVFFHQQEFAVLFEDGGDGDVGFQSWRDFKRIWACHKIQSSRQDKARTK